MACEGVPACGGTGQQRVSSQEQVAAGGAPPTAGCDAGDSGSSTASQQQANGAVSSSTSGSGSEENACCSGGHGGSSTGSGVEELAALDRELQQLEERFVHSVYDAIAPHFSATRSVAFYTFSWRQRWPAACFPLYLHALPPTLVCCPMPIPIPCHLPSTGLRCGPRCAPSSSRCRPVRWWRTWGAATASTLECGGTSSCWAATGARVRGSSWV